MPTHESVVVDKGFPSSCPHCQKNAQWQVVGCFASAATTGSSQITKTGASDYNLNQSAGYVVVDGEKLSLDAAADVDLDSEATNVLTDGQGRAYCGVAYKDSSGTVTTAVAKGTISAYTSAWSDIPDVTNAEIAATIGTGVEFIIMWRNKIRRNSDTTVVHETPYENSARFDGNLVTTTTTFS